MTRRKKTTPAQNTALVVNSAPIIPKRKLSSVNGDIYGSNTKHDYYSDFGWPQSPGFDQFFRMYCRNSIASAVVDKTISKVWQDDPAIWESEKPTESEAEKAIARRFADLRIWQRLADTDRRSMVGRYSAAILRLGDGQAFDQPVKRVPGGILGIAGIVPAWESQLYPSMWDQDVASANYGMPTMFQFSEAQIGDSNNAAPRSFPVHPDRIIIWSADGTVVGHSELESIYNDLIDAEKIKGAGGEGFWKTSRGALTVEAPEGVSPETLAQSMGVSVSQLRQALNDQVDDFQSGFDKMLMLGGMVAKTVAITMTSPEHFFAGPINSIAAARMIPVKILMGSQTGERASTEDAREWNLTCNSRRLNRCKPLILEMVNRFERWGIIPKRDWFVSWSDLTDSTAEGKMDRAFKMQEINAKAPPADIAPFSPEEIREAAGFDPDTLPDAPDEDDIDTDAASTDIVPGDQEETV